MRKIELQTLKLLLIKFEEQVDKDFLGDMPEKDWKECKEIMQICMRIPSGYEDLLK
jgi:hypothetical protein